MTVKLIDNSGGQYFDIFSTSTDSQAIFPGEITTWNFTVKPKEGGKHALVLKITIHVDGRNKDLDILEKEIIVTATEAGHSALPQEKITRILFISVNPLDTSPLRIVRKQGRSEKKSAFLTIEINLHLQ